jgi:poly(ADP-ribose) glycohydrolase ARH3
LAPRWSDSDTHDRLMLAPSFDQPTGLREHGRRVERLREKFRGCLLGSAVGDVAGAVVEAESPAYIAKQFGSVDDILAAGTVEEFQGPPWQVGRFTDDTQMMLCVAEWLIAGESDAPQRLLFRLAEAHEPWRRYGPGMEAILRLYREHPDQWRELATAAFPHGSLGNGSATRVSPVGLAYCRAPTRAATVARESSRPTHSHPLALQGAMIQAVAVATAVGLETFAAEPFLAASRDILHYFSELMQDVSAFTGALDAIERGLSRSASCAELAQTLGTGVTAPEAVPMALYCFLRHPHSYTDVIHHAVFAGGDTDTIASMAGAISGAFLGHDAIPPEWLDGIREPVHDAAAIADVADRLFTQHVEFGPA